MAETKLAELKLRLLEISDRAAAGALLGWDQSTYMAGWRLPVALAAPAPGLVLPDGIVSASPK